MNKSTQNKATAIAIAFLICICLTSMAQTHKISGKLIAPDGALISNATVTLKTRVDSQLVKGTISDSLGKFTLTDIVPGNYVLNIYAISRIAHSQVISIKSEDIELPTLQLSNNSAILKEVIVTGQRSFLRREVDKLVVDIEHSIYSKGENGMRLFNVIPGMQIDALGNIVFRGGENVTVYVDNRKVQLTGQQLLNYLKSIPSESIKSYEVRSVSGAQFDADNTGAVINIILKSDYRYGLTGSFGTDYQYTRYNNFSEWLALNYRIGKLTLQANASFYKGRQFDEQKEIQFYKNNRVYSFQDNNTVNNDIAFSNYKFGFDYRINSNQTISANYEKTLFPYHPSTNSVNRFTSETNTSINDSTIYTNNSKTVKQNTEQANVFYRNKLDSLGSTLDIGYSYVNYNNNYNSGIETNYQFPNNPSSHLSDSLFIDNPLSIQIHTINVDIEKVLTNSLSLNFGSKFNTSSTDNNISYFNGLTETGLFDSLRSNHFVYNEKILAFYGSFTKNWNKWSMKVGVRTENANYKGHSVSKFADNISRDKWSWFPTIFLLRKFSNVNSLTLAYSRSISRPSYQLLNPFENIQNPFYIEKGNPFLLPYFTHSLELSYLLHSKYSLTAGYKRTDKSINTVYQNNGAIIISTYENINNADDLFFSTSIPVKVLKWWEISNSLTLRYVKLKINEILVSRVREKFSQDIWVSNRLTFQKGFYAEVIGRYSRNQFLGIYDWNPQGTIDMNFKKSFLKDKLTATLNFADPFNIKRIGWKIDEAGFKRDVSSRIPTRYISIGLSYSFSKGKKESSRESINRKDADEVDRLNK